VLGPYEAIDADLWPVDALRGDRIILCSDGLSGEVTEDQISAVLRRLDDPTEAATELVRLANEAGGRDNITLIVVDVVDDGGVAEAASGAVAARRSHL
jgi:protein phosphatase